MYLAPEVDETWHALATLSPKRRVALVLRYYEDLSIEDVAKGDGVPCRHGQVTHPSRTGITTAGAAMNEPFEEQLRSTLRQVAQQTTTTHDVGLPPPSSRPSRSRRLVATAALALVALVGVGVLVATRDDGAQTVNAAAGDEANVPTTTLPSIGAAFGQHVCQRIQHHPAAALQRRAGRAARGDGQAVRRRSLAAANPLAKCGIEAGEIRDLFAPVLADLGPQLEQLKAIVAEFEPRIRAITDDPATKAKIEAALPHCASGSKAWLIRRRVPTSAIRQPARSWSMS